MIPQTVVAGILHWGLQAVVTVVLIGLAGYGIAFAVKKYFDFFTKKQADEYSLAAALVILAIASGSIGGVVLLVYALGLIGLLGVVVGVAIVAGGN